jgi:uncharacterized protein (TIGR04255 family)
MSTYKKNFLTDVILRLDFPPIPNRGDEDPPTTFEQKIIANFPIKEPVKGFVLTMENKEGDFTAERKEETVWRYKANDGKSLVEFKHDFLTIASKDYKDYSSFKVIAEKILKSFFESYEVKTINRMGLRYIDRIVLEEKDIFEWKEYLNADLLQGLNFFEDKKQVRRAMQVIESAPEPDTNLTFKYGIFNSWYPNELLQKEFFLDYDCYSFAFPVEEVEKNLDKFNKVATDYFEKSITDKLRAILNHE